MPSKQNSSRPRSTLLMICWAGCAFAQDRSTPLAAPVASSTSTENSEVPQVPGISGLLRGINAGLTFSGLHDAGTGWATIVQPALSYSFNDTFSIDVTVPIYMYRLAESQARRPRANARLVNQRGEPGDVVFGAHAQFLSPAIQYQASLSATAPTGDQKYGLTSGRATFDFTNHLEHSFTHVTPILEVGIGDSSTLVNRLVTKNYTTLGPLAHFQVGVAFPLFRGLSFETNAYEQLPVGDQKIYQSTTRRGSTRTFVVGRSVSEDNGFINSLDLPLDRHTTLSAYYNRSLRLRDDVVAIGLTYVLRGAGSRTEDSSTALSDAALLRALEDESDDGEFPPDEPPH